MDTVTAKLTTRLTRELDELIETGLYANRSEAIRDAVRDLLDRKRLQRLEAAVREDIAWGLRRG
jgi:putative addiction module CopG family antidote